MSVVEKCPRCGNYGVPKEPSPHVSIHLRAPVHLAVKRAYDSGYADGRAREFVARGTESTCVDPPEKCKVRVWDAGGDKAECGETLPCSKHVVNPRYVVVGQDREGNLLTVTSKVWIDRDAAASFVHDLNEEGVEHGYTYAALPVGSEVERVSEASALREALGDHWNFDVRPYGNHWCIVLTYYGDAEQDEDTAREMCDRFRRALEDTGEPTP